MDEFMKVMQGVGMLSLLCYGLLSYWVAWLYAKETFIRLTSASVLKFKLHWLRKSEQQAKEKLAQAEQGLKFIQNQIAELLA